MRSSDAIAVVSATKSLSIRTRPPNEASARQQAIEFYSIPASQQFRVVAVKVEDKKAKERGEVLVPVAITPIILSLRRSAKNFTKCPVWA